MSLVYRIASSTGQHLRKRLAALALGLATGVRRSVYDGHILQVQALGDGNHLAQAIDPPGYALLPGYQLKIAGLNPADDTNIQRAPVVKMPPRDTLLSADYFAGGGRLEPFPTGRTFVYQMMQTSLADPGMHDSGVVAPISLGDFVPGVGVLWSQARCSPPDTLAAWSKIPTGVPCDAEVWLVNPMSSRQTFAEDGTQTTTGEPQPRLSMRVIVIGEGYLKAFGSSALALTRQRENEGYWGDNAYHDINTPRIHCAAAGQGRDDQGVYQDVALAWEFCTDQQGVSDRYGRRHVAFIRLRVYAESARILNSAALRSTSMSELQPVLSGDAYLAHDFSINKLATFKDGTAVAVSRYERVSPGEVVDGTQHYYKHTSSLLARFDVDGTLSRQWIQQPIETNALDIYALYDVFTYAYGLDTDGEDYGIVVMTSMGGYVAKRGGVPYGPAVMGVFSFDKGGNVSAAATFSGAYLATGQDMAIGAGERLVRYIGNGKFLIIGASADGDKARDLRCYTFDRATGQVTQTAVIDPTRYLPIVTREAIGPYAYGPLSVGNLDVLVQELADSAGTVTRPAVLVLSRGGVGYRAAIVDQVAMDTAFPGSSGVTYISHDSGATWNVLADYGSGLGLIYTGNVLATRPFLGNQFT